MPKPTRKPPPRTNNNVRQLAMTSQENSALGCWPDNPNAHLVHSSHRRFAQGDGFVRSEHATAKNDPPQVAPAKTRFQDSPFQSYLRNSKLLGMQAAQWRNEELMPNVRFSKIRWRGTINPMMGPATYHGQGWLNHSTNAFMAAKVPPCFDFQQPPSHSVRASSTFSRAPKPTWFGPPAHIPSWHDAPTELRRNSSHHFKVVAKMRAWHDGGM